MDDKRERENKFMTLTCTGPLIFPETLDASVVTAEASDATAQAWVSAE